jgi:RHS repeat-associated protein
VAPRTTKYYYHGGKRVAMRVDEDGESEVYYLHGDHLGSTSLTTNDSGAVVARQLYHPYGTTRYTDGTLPTDFEFTGQRKDSYTQLTLMGARWYDPRIGRWISPDSIVPDPSNSQSLNRFSYVNNRPLNFTDPSGHAAESSDSVGLENEGYYWYWFYSTNPDVYYTHYWAAEAGQGVRSLTLAWAYEQNTLHTFGTLDEGIASAMVNRYNAEILKEDPNRGILLTCVGFVAGMDEDSMQYIDNASRGWGMSSPGSGGGGIGGGGGTGRGSTNPYKAKHGGRIHPNHIVRQQEIGNLLYDDLTALGYDVEIRYHRMAFDVNGDPVVNGRTGNWALADVQAFDKNTGVPLSMPYEIEWAGPKLTSRWDFKDVTYGPVPYGRVTYTR